MKYLWILFLIASCGGKSNIDEEKRLERNLVDLSVETSTPASSPGIYLNEISVLMGEKSYRDQGFFINREIDLLISNILHIDEGRSFAQQIYLKFSLDSPIFSQEFLNEKVLIKVQNFCHEKVNEECHQYESIINLEVDGKEEENRRFYIITEKLRDTEYRVINPYEEKPWRSLETWKFTRRGVGDSGWPKINYFFKDFGRRENLKPFGTFAQKGGENTLCPACIPWQVSFYNTELLLPIEVNGESIIYSMSDSVYLVPKENYISMFFIEGQSISSDYTFKTKVELKFYDFVEEENE